MTGTLNYNNKKVEEGVARIVGTFNIPGLDRISDIKKIFNDYEMRNIRSENVSFQMSINPDPDNPSERYTDDEIQSYIKELMDGLGYGNQPIAIYAHEDIDRLHYHVVSIRTDDKGKKIKDYYEEFKLQNIAKALAPKYHYKLAGDKASQKTENAKEINTKRYDATCGDIGQQFKEIFKEALSWKFTTYTQFITIMKSMNVDAKAISGEEKKLILHGLDKNGEKVNRHISEEELGLKMFQEMSERIEECKNIKPATPEEKKERSRNIFRIRKTVENCLKYSKSQEHLEGMLAKKGITMNFSTGINGNIFGVTFADAKTKSAYKGSEIGKEVGADVFEHAKARWQSIHEEVEAAKDRAALISMMKDYDAIVPDEDTSEKENSEYKSLALDVIDEIFGVMENADTHEEDIYARRAKKKKKKGQGVPKPRRRS